MDNMKIFENSEFGKLSVLIENDKPLFPATDVAKMLGYSDPYQAIRKNCKGLSTRQVPTNGGNQQKTFIPESDVYRLVMRSKLPSAERFQDWVVEEVLPSIRRQGMYATDATIDQMIADPEFGMRLLASLKEEREKNKLLADKVNWLEPKATYCNIILNSPNTIPITTIAKDYGMGARTFNQLLMSHGIQFRYTTTWYLNQKYAGEGYTDTETYWHEGGCTVRTKWTQKGRMFLYNFLKEKGILPLCERKTA